MKYLASPYTHKDPEIAKTRMEAFCEADRHFTREGHHIVSPLYKTLTLGDDFDLSFEKWEVYCNLLLNRCDVLIVIKSEGWENSTGVGMEIKWAREIGLDIWYFNPDKKQVDLFERQ